MDEDDESMASSTPSIEEIQEYARLTGQALRHLHDGEYEAAITIYDSLQRKFPNPANLLFAARALVQLGRIQEAREHLLRARKLAPDDKDIEAQLASILGHEEELLIRFLAGKILHENYGRSECQKVVDQNGDLIGAKMLRILRETTLYHVQQAKSHIVSALSQIAQIVGAEPEEPTSRAIVAEICALEHFVGNQFGEAVEHFQQAIAIYRELDDAESLAGCLNQLGLAAAHGRFELAQLAYAESIQIERRQGRHQQLVRVMENFASLLFNKLDYVGSYLLAEASEKLYSEAGQPGMALKAHSLQAKCLLGMGLYSAAHQRLDACIASGRELWSDMPVVLGDALVSKGTALLRQGRKEESQEARREAKAVYQAAGIADTHRLIESEDTDFLLTPNWTWDDVQMPSWWMDPPQLRQRSPEAKQGGGTVIDRRMARRLWKVVQLANGPQIFPSRQLIAALMIGGHVSYPQALNEAAKHLCGQSIELKCRIPYEIPSHMLTSYYSLDASIQLKLCEILRSSGLLGFYADRLHDPSLADLAGLDAGDFAAGMAMDFDLIDKFVGDRAAASAESKSFSGMLAAVVEIAQTSSGIPVSSHASLCVQHLQKLGRNIWRAVHLERRLANALPTHVVRFRDLQKLVHSDAAVAVRELAAKLTSDSTSSDDEDASAEVIDTACAAVEAIGIPFESLVLGDVTEVEDVSDIPFPDRVPEEDRLNGLLQAPCVRFHQATAITRCLAGEADKVELAGIFSVRLWRDVGPSQEELMLKALLNSSQLTDVIAMYLPIH